MIENVKVSEKARLQLITIKKRTKIKNWNVICRWAFLLSLRDKSTPAEENIITDSSVEMTWKTFAGTHDKLYKSLLIYKLQKDNIELTKDNIIKYFKIYLHRGISFLTSSNFKNTNDFLSIINE
tara:strand:+ start:696 stop:1067 length:372 start_codon:yes stop_codon:yes gene_type:complete